MPKRHAPAPETGAEPFILSSLEIIKLARHQFLTASLSYESDYNLPSEK